ncbi:MAG: hypothetical protein LKH04_01795 [Lachnospiraceae bacterium]|jgi:hypothetical protein|nr:hypothetical protein [Lachnospiraceae bacterium]MCI1397810.1 hypothetical protein [Lachnospiraceae bacterium]MCI1423024.1 hypothetical protein [Lachnospiraceae bacterium]MCI1451762.1 hypothetical protein [Lachnospiraceae bacterium]MDD5849956.1 hypothetical protein [Bacillota bacterium]
MAPSEKKLVYPLTGARAQDSLYYVTGDHWCIEGEEAGQRVQIPGRGKSEEEWEALLHAYADRGFVLVWQSGEPC